MIKVNLLKNESSTKAAKSFTFTSMNLKDMFTSVSPGASGLEPVRVVINGVIILSATVGLYMYERYNRNNLALELATLTSQTAKLAEVLKKKKEEANESEPMKKKARELSTKIDIVTRLSKVRLREIKALDFIQSVIPERIWFKTLVLKTGDLTIKGSAISDDDLTQFVRYLENNSMFRNVLLLQAKEEQTKEGSVKVFEIAARMEAEE